MRRPSPTSAIGRIEDQGNELRELRELRRQLVERDIGGGAGHRAIHDCRATRAVWRYPCRSAGRGADAGAERRSGR